jgi:membrane associated rhomboid family serine protease
MFPYHDENATQRTPVVTMALIALNVAAFVGIQGAGAEEPLAASVCNLGLIPAELMASASPGAAFPMGERLVCVTDPGRQPLNVFTSMFMHGGWMHLIGNMLFLWIFGDNVEDSMGHGRFIVFYLVCGVAAALAQAIPEPSSQIPMVGASGAISGVLGAYLLLHPHARVLVAVPFGFILHTMRLPAGIVLALWFVLQLFSNLMSQPGQGGVAFRAHIGGFVAGMLLVGLFKKRNIRLFAPAR